MSAFNVNDDHIRYLLRAKYKYSANHEYRNRTIEDWRADGVMLRNANVQSVNFRYGYEGSGSADTMCGPMVTDFDVQLSDLLDAPCAVPQTFSAIHCMEYQCCETPDWRETPAFEWLQDLKESAARRMDGYEDADWEIDPDKQPRQVRNIRRLV
ncbi:MAG: hypothetical protein NUW01_00040 [Gemmatimonadaceae bacterium]|nr:hypothetical protein [Gemmatimonadaceae bacterium]